MYIVYYFLFFVQSKSGEEIEVDEIAALGLSDEQVAGR